MQIEVNIQDLRALLNGQSEAPVLYVERDTDTGKPIGLDVWAEAYVPHRDIVARQHELKDVVGAVDDDEDLAGVLSEYQQCADEILSAD
ncbi:hypothetical protein [Streptomyces sp. NPDC088727]|uniref:hypothetical protein n=1 Tax=Streptomyces sp. NPDC088727 TaxID=3365875 RepID=UPI003820A7F8